MLKSKYSTGWEGRRYGRWLVLSFSHAHRGAKGFRYYWNCRCDCGAERKVRADQMLSGKSQSCRCLKNEQTAQRTKHGETKDSRQRGPSRSYSSWHHMMQRTTNPNNARWDRYGGRGIRVCAAFKDPGTFCRVMGERPIRMTVDRINNNGHYSCGSCHECLANGWPSNCRWATYKQQAANQTHPGKWKQRLARVET